MPAPAKILRPKALDSLIDKIANRYLAGVQIPLLEITNIAKAGRAAYDNTHDILEVEAAIAKAIAAVRVN